MVKPFRRISLSLSVAILSVSQIVIAVGLTGYLYFRNSEKAVTKLANQLRQEATHHVTKNLENYLAVPQQVNKVNENAFKRNRLDINDKQALEKHFWELLNIFENIDNIAFATPEEEFTAIEYNRAQEIVAVTAGRETENLMTVYELDNRGNRRRKQKVLNTFDLYTREWYTTTVEAGKPIWNPIFPFFSDRRTVVLSASYPVYEAEELVGVFTTRLYLSRISEFLQELKISDGSEVFILERDGKLVASSDEDDLFLNGKSDRVRIPANQAKRPIIQKTTQFIQQQHNGKLEQIEKAQYLDFKLNNERQYLKVTPFQDDLGIDWLVVVVIPERDFMGVIHANTRSTIILCAIALATITVISLIATQRSIHPIFELITASQALSQGKWQQRVQDSRIRELSLLSHTFNRMAAQIQDSFKSLEQAEAKYRDIFENALEGIFQSTPEGSFLSVNPAFAKMFGYESPTALIAAIDDISQQVYLNPEDRQIFKESIATQGSVTDFQTQVYRRDRSVIWISVYARAKRDRDGTILYYEGTVEEITQNKITEAQLKYNANHDELTGLYNRKAFLAHLQQSLETAKVNSDYRFAVLFFDLDDFKLVNDSLGHLVGDRLLIAVVQSIQAFLPKDSIFARFGGDEFILLLNDLQRLDDAIAIACQINKTLQSPFQLDSHETFVSSSIGIVFSYNLNQTPEDFLRDADTALYEAKAKGKGRYEVFDRQMHATIRRRLQLETDLRYALERQEITILYQPIVDTFSHQIVGFEALSRWYHPRQGWISPCEFIPIAEETGSIVPLGWSLIERVCQQWLEWRKYSDRELFMSINWSSKQLVQVDLIPQLKSILEQYQCPPSCLKIEITESSLLRNTTAVNDKLNELVNLGVRLSIDDFGTGYSSLSYLHQFPFKTLKIDRSFIRHLDCDSQNQEIVEVIIQLAHHLRLDAIAEGVETANQLKALEKMNCDQIQGYFFYPPLPGDRITQILQET